MNDQWWDFQSVEMFWEQGQDYFGQGSVMIARCVIECVQEAELYGYYGPEPPVYEPVAVESIIVRPIHKWYGKGMKSSVAGG